MEIIIWINILFWNINEFVMKSKNNKSVIRAYNNICDHYDDKICKSGNNEFFW